VELIEFPDSGPESLCCGGGAGGLWLETKKGERLCDLKMEQAIELEADILAVACPYCMSMFKDSQLTVPKGDSLQIMDISELIQEAM
jgi:Fe-S oxidoreductase